MKEIEMSKKTISYDHARKPCGCELKVGNTPCNLHAAAMVLLEAAKEARNFQRLLGADADVRLTNKLDRAIAKAERR